MDYNKFHNQVVDSPSSYLNVQEQWPEITRYVYSNIDKKEKILELGSGGGFFVNWLYKNGYKNTIASDISTTALKIINNKFPYIKQELINAEDIKSHSTFDLVIGLDIIEHLPDTVKHLSSVYNILNDNGKYIIKTPNKLLENIYYKGILLRSDKQKIHPWWTAHVSLFSLKKLCFSLRSAGFKKINILDRENYLRLK